MEQKNLQSLAEECASDVAYIQTLLRAGDAQVRLYLEDRTILGPYGEFLHSHALGLASLLSLTGHLADKLEQELETVSDILYRMEA